ncbi:MAG: hypothetical protein IPK52_08965 [Chloroflexi bacterium]|nr:hypothetical protein [Chloroflexota bacterium]
MADDLNAKVVELRVLVSAARAMDALVEVYARLIDLAALMVEHGKKSEAAAILAYIMHQPDVPYDEYDRADDLWIDLEAELCPRVISDARADATFMTLRGIIDQAFAHFLPPPDPADA